MLLSKTINAVIKKEKHRELLLGSMLKGSVCAEIGVWKGKFAKQILEIIKPSKLHLIDPWRYMPEYKNRLYGGGWAKSQEDMDFIYSGLEQELSRRPEVIFHRDYSDKAVKKFEGEYFDWIYIDANHSYEFVIKDLSLYLPKVKIGGFITGDDYSSWGRLRNYGVKKAVDDFIKKGSVEIVSLKGNQFILRKL